MTNMLQSSRKMWKHLETEGMQVLLINNINWCRCHRKSLKDSMGWMLKLCLGGLLYILVENFTLVSIKRYEMFVKYEVDEISSLF